MHGRSRRRRLSSQVCRCSGGGKAGDACICTLAGEAGWRALAEFRLRCSVWLDRLAKNRRWVGQHRGDVVAGSKIRIRTQETFEKLPGHSMDSRPDVVIRLVAAGKTELIFIESKLPSKQGEDQLARNELPRETFKEETSTLQGLHPSASSRG